MSARRSPEPVVERPYHHGQLREALVDAAFDLARTGGPEAVIVRAATRAAGVSHNAAYRHFADRDQLLRAVSERCLLQIAARMAQRMAEVPETDPVGDAWARLHAIGRGYVEFAVAEPGWFRTAFALPDDLEPFPAVGACSGDVPGPGELLNGRLDELVTVGAVPAERRPGLEFAAWSGVHGLAALLIDGPLRRLSAAEQEEILTTVLGVIARGL